MRLLQEHIMYICSAICQVTNVKAKTLNSIISFYNIPQKGHCVFYGVECWSVVLEWSIGLEWSQIVEWQMLGTVLLAGITEYNTIGKIDCSYDPGRMSRRV